MKNRSKSAMTRGAPPTKEWLENHLKYLKSKIGDIEYHPTRRELGELPSIIESLEYYSDAFKNAGLEKELDALRTRTNVIKQRYGAVRRKSTIKTNEDETKMRNNGFTTEQMSKFNAWIKKNTTDKGLAPAVPLTSDALADAFPELGNTRREREFYAEQIVKKYKTSRGRTKNVQPNVLPGENDYVITRDRGDLSQWKGSGKKNVWMGSISDVGDYRSLVEALQDIYIKEGAKAKKRKFNVWQEGTGNKFYPSEDWDEFLKRVDTYRREKARLPNTIVAGWGGVEIHPGNRFQTATVSADASAYERWGETADWNIRSALAAETKGAKWDVTFEGIRGTRAHWTAKRLPRKAKKAKKESREKSDGKPREDPHSVMILKGKKIAMSSANLAAITRYNRERSSIKEMMIGKLSEGRGLLKVTFEDGADATVVFEDYSVLKDWSEKKKRRFGFNLVERLD